mmetsp:Transcript_1755/g.4480  ORF Transcript_1755/g.4480 Transcript_1755/m.4480 type:complete len:249 (-) Transcript_1755:262-1008(-)
MRDAVRAQLDDRPGGEAARCAHARPAALGRTVAQDHRHCRGHLLDGRRVLPPAGDGGAQKGLRRVPVPRRGALDRRDRSDGAWRGGALRRAARRDRCHDGHLHQVVWLCGRLHCRLVARDRDAARTLAGGALRLRHVAAGRAAGAVVGARDQPGGRATEQGGAARPRQARGAAREHPLLPPRARRDGLRGARGRRLARRAHHDLPPGENGAVQSADAQARDRGGGGGLPGHAAPPLARPLLHLGRAHA